MYRISKSFTFEASHALDHLPENHKCHNLHGHSYTVTLTLESKKLDDSWFVVDYKELDIAKSFIDRNLDHQHLNDVLPCPPTAEAIARYLYKVFRESFHQLKSVTVSETDKTSATYEE